MNDLMRQASPTGRIQRTEIIAHVILDALRYVAVLQGLGCLFLIIGVNTVVGHQRALTGGRCAVYLADGRPTLALAGHVNAFSLAITKSVGDVHRLIRGFPRTSRLIGRYQSARFLRRSLYSAAIRVAVAAATATVGTLLTPALSLLPLPPLALPLLPLALLSLSLTLLSRILALTLLFAKLGDDAASFLNLPQRSLEGFLIGYLLADLTHPLCRAAQRFPRSLGIAFAHRLCRVT